MRILLLSQFYPPVIGGEEIHVKNLARALGSRGHHVEVLTTALSGADDGFGEEDGVLLHRVRASAQRFPQLFDNAARPHALPVADPAMSRAIATVISERKMDIVHAHNWIVNSALGPTRRAGIPLVQTLHDYSHICAVKRFVRNNKEQCEGPTPSRCLPCATRHYGALEGPAVACANALSNQLRRRSVTRFVAVSHAVAGYSGLPKSGVAYDVIPNFVPDELLLEPLEVASDAPYMFLGDLVPDKGVEVLLAAYRLLEAPPKLLLVGHPSKSVQLDLPVGVEVLPGVPHEVALDLVRRARALVHPAIVPDACPTVVLEAMAAGRPVIASPRGGIVDLVVDGVTGMLVEPRPPALAAALQSLAQDPARARKLGAAGRARAEEFSASAVAARLEAVYQSAQDSLSQSRAR